ncbi:MAG: phage integrase SAM-like domain-containing protein [Prevotellaceae bacterium]|nr:phage integrase SAM-like domain-containing protein [Prevotellaceae bacterium]
MAKKKLYQTAEEIIAGYCLTTGKVHRKVYLIGRPLKTGNVSLVRYHSNGSGKFRVRERETTGVILCKETDYSIKLENEEKLRLQQVVCDTINADLEREEADFKPLPKMKVSLSEYARELGERSLKKTGNRHSTYSSMNSLAQHVELFRPHSQLGDIDKKWCLLFIDYLKRKALNLNYQRSKDPNKRKEVVIGQNSQNRLIATLNNALNTAVRESLITHNPVNDLDSKEKVPAKKGTREFLSQKEINMLINTPFTHGRYDIKPSFLFSCYTGLRWSDLKAITKNDIHSDENGRYIDIIMIKTKQHLKVYVPQVALNLLPHTVGNVPLFRLPKNDYANGQLALWIKDAGIEKKITYHVSSHNKIFY